jgi:hypothetical protein
MTMLLDPAKDIKIGTSGYSYPGVPPKGWRGAFYPEKKTKGFDELKYYSQVFNTVRSTTPSTVLHPLKLLRLGRPKRQMISRFL